MAKEVDSKVKRETFYVSPLLLDDILRINPTDLDQPQSKRPCSPIGIGKEGRVVTGIHEAGSLVLSEGSNRLLLLKIDIEKWISPRQ